MMGDMVKGRLSHTAFKFWRKMYCPMVKNIHTKNKVQKNCTMSSFGGYFEAIGPIPTP